MKPRLTVVVVILQGRSSLFRCLSALSRQIGEKSLEIIVPYDERFRGVFDLQKDFPNVQFLLANGVRTYAELRALGVQKARGEIIALTEDHCTPNLDWCAQILRAHTMSHAAIGGAVDKMAPDSVLNWAMYFADYVRYMNPVREGPSNALTDCNVTYKRSALESIGNVWRDEFHEPEVHHALQSRGESLWLSSHIVVRQQRSLRLREAMSDRYAFGRLFGCGRVSATALWQRLIYAGGAMLLPSVLVARVAGNVFRRRQWVVQFFLALPAVMLLSVVWAWGEFIGYLTARPESSLTPRRRTKSISHHVEGATT